LHGDQLRQAWLDDWIFQGVLDVEHLPPTVPAPPPEAAPPEAAPPEAAPQEAAPQETATGRAT
jgi:hypothetical protein